MKEGHKGAESETPAVDLRNQAEKIARAEEAQTREAMSPEETRQTLHELRVHQIELTMQNEELRRAQAELDAAQARYFDLYDLAPVGYCTLSEPGLILEANLTAVNLLGAARGALINQRISRFILKEDHNIYYLHRKQLFETGEPQACELRMVKSDGAQFWSRLEATWAQDTDGAPTCRIVLSDIAERKKTEEALQRAHDELEQRVAEQTAELRQANEELRTDIIKRKLAEEERRILQERLRQADKMESIGTLAGGIAHDFNNLLMGIQGHASLTLLDLDPSHPHYERLKSIEEQVQSGADLTRQLLGFAREGRYEVKPADMNDIINKTSSMFGRTKKEISIHRKYGKGLWTVGVDRGQMEQVFMNLYVNAWQAMPGGGEIYLETENVLLEDEQAFPYAITPGKYVKISVTDTGTGMDEKTRERIFDPFFTTKEMGRGIGLGLATVYGIIKGHGGMIDVYSKPGHGTTFHIYLPASEKEVVTEKTATGTIARGTETILLVDDEKMVLEVSKELLESMGYQVYPAGSGQEAIAVYMEKQKEINLVILDMIMPGMSGGETFDRLREINPGIKVLLSSGYSIEGQAQEIMDR
ncbi:MAG: response regulator, partial [Deltaproteobacteria bacterium]